MQVTETTAEGLRHTFKIVVPAADIESRIENRLKAVAKRVNLPGFRPGKAPLSIMRKRYVDSVMGEILEESVQDGVRHTLEDRKLTPAMRPKTEVTAFEQGENLEFTVEFDAVPEVGDVDFGAIELDKPKVSVDESDIDAALERIAESRRITEASASKRKVKKKDIVEIDFAGSIDGVGFAGGKGEGVELELGAGAFIAGFEDQLIGAKPGETVTVDVVFPRDYHAKDMAGKAARFLVTVKALKTAKIPQIDDAFAKGAGMESLDALRKAVREQIEGERERLSRDKVKRDLLDALAELATFELPRSMVDAEFDAIWSQIEAAIKDDALEEKDTGKSKDELSAKYRGIAERRVRLGLLLADVGRKGSIEVSQEELNRAVTQEAKRHRGQEHTVFKFFQENQRALDELRAPIYEDKVVDYILELAKITEKEASDAELTEAAAPKAARSAASQKKGEKTP